MKKILSFILIIFMILGMSACGDETKEGSKAEQSEQTSEEASMGSSEGASETASEESAEESSEMPEKTYETSFADPLEVGYEKYENPFNPWIADPDIVYHDGKYYHVFGAWGCLFVSTFDDFANYTTDGAAMILQFVEGKPWAMDVWAPEIHFVDGYWYVYFSSAEKGTNESHRMYAMKSKTDNPMGEYEEPVKLTDSTDKWAIDGTIFKYKGELYTVWSGWEGDENLAQNLYIAKMENPMKISSERVCISTPRYTWEQFGGVPYVNEGPYAIVDGDYLTILFSASGSWCDRYCIGQLLFTGDDVLDGNSWKKFEKPIHQSVRNKYYGPGHCSVVPDKNGVLWMIFHANEISGTGWEGRSGWMHPIRINEKGKVEVIIY